MNSEDFALYLMGVISLAALVASEQTAHISLLILIGGAFGGALLEAWAWWGKRTKQKRKNHED